MLYDRTLMAIQQNHQDLDSRTGPDELDRLADRLNPSRNRPEVLHRLQQLFVAGTAPDPWPQGPLAGRLLATSTWAPLDSFATRLTGLWMPWLGKRFDRTNETGVNRFLATRPTRLWLRVAFPGYPPEGVLPEQVEAFPFRNWTGSGELDHGVTVLKIEYEHMTNPPLVRRVLDELVEVAPGTYLGKALLRFRGRYRQVAFFSLRS
jgi:hypothetical protein